MEGAGLLQALVIPTLAIDTGGRVLYANAAAAHLLAHAGLERATRVLAELQQLDSHAASS